MKDHFSLPRVYIVAFFLIFSIALGLRFYNLGKTSLWLDESIFANLLKNSNSFYEYFVSYRNYSPALWPAFQWLVCNDSSPILYFRLVSAIAGIGTVLVMLLLPLAGISRIAALLAGLWVAISPVLVEYSQEAREYSLGVFFSAALLFSFTAYWNKPEPRWPLYCCCIFIFLAPFSTYGNVLLSSAFVSCHLICLIFEGKILSTRSFAIFSAYILGITLTFFLTARFQMGLKDADGNWLYNSMWFVVGNYPPDGIFPALNWMKVNLKDYLAWAWGGGRTVEIISLAVAIVIIAKPKRELLFSPNERLLIVMGCLILGSLSLAFLGKYPFGGLRYHVVAIPLLIIVASEALVFIKKKMGLGLVPFLALFGVIVVYGAVVDLPPVYKEKQDICGVINSLPQGTGDDQVFIYENAIYAADFHFPERKFHRFKTMDIPRAFAELEGLESQTIYFIFSDSISPDGIEQINKECKRLELIGFCVAEDEEFRGVKRIRIEKPQQGADRYKTGDLPAKLV